MTKMLLLAVLSAPSFAALQAAPAGPEASAPVVARATPAAASRTVEAEVAKVAGAKDERAAARVEAALAHDEAQAQLVGLPAAALASHRVPATAEAPLSVGIWPGQPYQGALLVVDVATAGPIAEASGSFLGKELTFHRLDERTWRAMGPVPDDAEVGPATLALQVKAGGEGASTTVERKVELQIRPLEYEHDELRVDSKFTSLSKKALARVRRDRAAMAAMWKKGSEPSAIVQRFAIPREDRTTAPYGTRRVYNGKTRSVHRGWDIDGDVGEEIRSPNAGVVTMTRDQYYSGGTLFIDHGGGLYTGYFHMDGFAVKEGERVEAGQLLGTVGKSGRVTGPHLHWAAKIGGHYIHPASLLLFDFTRPMVQPPAAGEGLDVVPAAAGR